jgi:hypothetical protein
MDSNLKGIEFVTTKNKYTIFYYKIPVSFGSPYVMPERRLRGYNYCGPFTRLDERLASGDAPVNNLDAGCQKHDIFY